MFRFIKSLFHESRRAEPVSNSSTAAPLPTPPHQVEKRPVSIPHPTSVVPAEPLHLPLQAIADRLAPVLAQRLSRPLHGNDQLALPLASVLAQLPSGMVRFSFKEIREYAPRGLFRNEGDLDANIVDLPLTEILPRLDRKHLARNPQQRPMVLSLDPGPVFQSNSHRPGEGKATPVQPPADWAPPARAVALSRPAAEAVAPTVASAPRGFTKGAPRPATAPTLAPKLEAPAIPMDVAFGKLPERTKPSADAATVKVALASLARHWPDPAREQILGAHLAAAVNIPIADLEPALARGKAAFTWERIRSWLSPAAPTSLSQFNNLLFDLPLSVLIPPFLARRSPPSGRPKAVGSELPDVFIARKPGSETSSRRPQNGVAHEVPVPGPRPAAGPVASEIPMTTVVGRPASDHNGSLPAPTPAEVVQRACRLTGVAGAVVASGDGLPIASQLPPGLNPETFAGFLPQMLHRVGQCTSELNLGEPSQMELQVEGVPLHLVRQKELIFGVLGKLGEPLPKSQVNALAGQLTAASK